MSLALVGDLALAGFLLTLALTVLLSDRDRVAVGAFIALGAVAAILWARLGAPDVALAEAVIGAGLMGALLLRHLGLSRTRDR